MKQGVNTVHVAQYRHQWQIPFEYGLKDLVSIKKGNLSNS
jgi:hypothetical protein